MESLAIAAAATMLLILACAVVSAVAVIRPPTGPVPRVLITLCGVGAVLSGQWMARLEVGSGARVIGACAVVLGAGALWRTWRRRRSGSVPRRA